MDNKGKAIIFSAPSGAGKTTIVKHLLGLNLGLEFSTSACSRDRRETEIDGKDYHFLGIDEFKSRIENNDFIEWEEVYKDNYYGTLKSEIDRVWENQNTVIFDVDVIGGLNLKKYFGDRALSIFVQAPSIDHLEQRLKSRQTETDITLKKRLGKAQEEMQYAKDFDYILVNDVMSEAFSEAEEVLKNFLEK